TVCVVGKMRDLILQLSKSSIYSTKPRSGYPLDNELDSVTVISADSLDGDIWTTLLFGLGVEKGCAALRQRQDIDAIFVTKNRDIILSSPQRLRFAPLDSGYRVIDCTA
ncbi:FAD:protein FMN transferase, partial [Klebsiella pneumoniae]